MPNWCSNRATITGPAPVIAEIVEILNQDGTPLLNWMVPEPKDNEGWYDWRVNNWGTKWDITDVYFENQAEEDSIEFSFCTAWAPPTEAFHTWAELDGRQCVLWVGNFYKQQLGVNPGNAGDSINTTAYAVRTRVPSLGAFRGHPRRGRAGVARRLDDRAQQARQLVVYVRSGRIRRAAGVGLEVVQGRYDSRFEVVERDEEGGLVDVVDPDIGGVGIDRGVVVIVDALRDEGVVQLHHGEL